MARKSTKIFNIGDSFLSWKVVECVNPKKYRYKCRCSCGNEREFNKYNLLRGSYAPCKACNHVYLRNTQLIKKHWNNELNGRIFTKPQDFDLTHSYWFICNNGHNFKSSIKDFNIDRCLSCKCKTKSNHLSTQAIEYATQLFSRVFDKVYVDRFGVVIGDVNAIVLIVESDRFDSYRNYYSSEEEYIKDVTDRQLFISEYKLKGIKVLKVLVENNLQKNVDTFKRIMVQLVHSK